MDTFGVCGTQNFGYSLLTVFLVVMFIGILRAFAGINKTALGPELNLLTYGFLVDVAMKAIRNKPYWPRYSTPWDWDVQYKPTVLFLIALMNFILMIWNIKVAEPRVVSGTLEKPSIWRSAFSAVLGLLSLLTYFVCQSCWEEL
ncbi:hypothetical protein os1_17860 [Comamonadaceae bacterium OS-1]|nr:hypothetical protein os1_17860 [Comamonadaceae bacterium OS-1]